MQNADSQSALSLNCGSGGDFMLLLLIQPPDLASISDGVASAPQISGNRIVLGTMKMGT